MQFRATQTIVYRKGTTLVLADTLSRAYLPATEDATSLAERVCMVASQEDIETVNATDEVSGISDERLEEIIEHTKNDATLQQLPRIIVSGWPASKQGVPPSVQPYFIIRDELVVRNGIIFKGSWCVVPEMLGPKILERIHTEHMGVEGSLRRARESVYLPGMNAAVKDFFKM